MFKLKKYLFLFKIVLFICLVLLFVLNNNSHQVMAMENSKDTQITNEAKILNNKTYIYFLKEQIILQEQLSNYVLTKTKQKILITKYNCINQKIKDYEQRKNKNSSSQKRDCDKPESSNSKN